MKTRQILKTLNWSDIFGNTSQYENLYDFLKGNTNLDEFIAGFYPRCKNKKLIKGLSKKGIPMFKKHAKKLWNISNVQNFSNGCEDERRIEYLKKI